jgi:hypothetical protein
MVRFSYTLGLLLVEYQRPNAPSSLIPMMPVVQSELKRHQAAHLSARMKTLQVTPVQDRFSTPCLVHKVGEQNYDWYVRRAYI